MPVKFGSFSVPVDLQRLQALRKAAGFSSNRAYAAELRRRGYTFNYRSVEKPGQPSRGQTINRISNTTAEAVAEALGLEPDEVFPEYSAAKAEAERRLTEGRYKPFSTITERNVAIVENMDMAKYTAWKFADLSCEGVPIGREEAVSCAYETLVETADFVMKYGLPEGIPFNGYACRAIKSTIIQKYCGSATSSKRKYSVCSLDVFSPDYLRGEYAPDPAELYILMEELEEQQNSGKSRP